MPTVNLPDNLEMYYDDDDYTDPWRTPETVVLHHGNAKNGRLWYAWVPLLARQYRVARLDARGFGRSTVPPEGYDWSLSGFAGDLLGLLDHLELDKVHLIGETVGGTVALQFALRTPRTPAHRHHLHFPLQVRGRAPIPGKPRPDSRPRH